MIYLHPGYERIVEKEAGTFKYFLKIVPTEYVNLRGDPRLWFLTCDMGLMFAACCELHY